MYKDYRITPPFFEIGLKAYLWGKKVLDLAIFANEISQKYKVQIIITPQYVDLSEVAKACPNLHVYAQHMDTLPVGRGVGSVLPEAIKDSGAKGILLNHAEKPLPRDVIERTIRRADEVGLASMVCAGSRDELDAIARMTPNIILAEAPQLIGIGKRSPADQDAIRWTNELVRNIDPAIHVLHGAGIADDHDVYEIISLGAEATGSTSGILSAKDPFLMLEKMIQAVRAAWDDHPERRNQ